MLDCYCCYPRRPGSYTLSCCSKMKENTIGKNYSTKCRLTLLRSQKPRSPTTPMMPACSDQPQPLTNGWSPKRSGCCLSMTQQDYASLGSFEIDKTFSPCRRDVECWQAGRMLLSQLPCWRSLPVLHMSMDGPSAFMRSGRQPHGCMQNEPSEQPTRCMSMQGKLHLRTGCSLSPQSWHE